NNGAPLPRPDTLPLPNVVTLFVRSLVDNTTAVNDPRVDVTFPIADTSSRTLPITFRTTFYSAYITYSGQDRIWFRPSWAPDGKRVVLSDATQLRIWNIGDTNTTAVPNTQDATEAAWSPDGNWIAYTRTERADSLKGRCMYNAGVTPVCIEDVTIYKLGQNILTIIHPDGTGKRELGDGMQPA